MQVTLWYYEYRRGHYAPIRDLQGHGPCFASRAAIYESRQNFRITTGNLHKYLCGS